MKASTQTPLITVVILRLKCRPFCGLLGQSCTCSVGSPISVHCAQTHRPRLVPRMYQTRLPHSLHSYGSLCLTLFLPWSSSFRCQPKCHLLKVTLPKLHPTFLWLRSVSSFKADPQVLAFCLSFLPSSLLSLLVHFLSPFPIKLPFEDESYITFPSESSYDRT